MWSDVQESEPSVVDCFLGFPDADMGRSKKRTAVRRSAKCEWDGYSALKVSESSPLDQSSLPLSYVIAMGRFRNS